MKICVVCKKAKPLVKFYRYSSSYDCKCRVCRKESNKEYYGGRKEYYQKYREKYYKEHKEYYQKYHREYFQTHRAKISIWQQEYLQTSKGMAARVSYAHRYRVRLLACDINDLTNDQILILFGRVTYCPVCGEEFNSSSMRKKTLDHKVPLSKGGQHTLGAVQVLCKSCNSRKTDRVISNEELTREIELV